MVGPGAIVWILSVAAVGVDAEKIAVIQDTSTIAATEGDTVIIPCSHNSTDQIWAYHWFKGATNGTSVSNYTGEYRGRVFRLKAPDAAASDMDASIQLKNVRINDSGLYFCRVKTLRSEAYGTGTYLTVNAGRNKYFAVKQGQSRIVADEGQTVLMSCAHNANRSRGASEYSWHKDGKQVSNETQEYAGRVIGPLQDDSFNTSIQLVDVRQSDSGDYYCKVRIEGLGEADGEGVSLEVNGTGKIKRATILLLILAFSVVLEGCILFVSIHLCRQTRRAKRTIQDQSLEAFPLTPMVTDADPTSPLTDDKPELESQLANPSIYLPMESLRTFNAPPDQDGDTKTQRNIIHITHGNTSTDEGIQYAIIIQKPSTDQPPNASVGDDEMQQDDGYDELNVMAKRGLNPEEN